MLGRCSGCVYTCIASAAAHASDAAHVSAAACRWTDPRTDAPTCSGAQEFKAAAAIDAGLKPDAAPPKANVDALPGAIAVAHNTGRLRQLPVFDTEPRLVRHFSRTNADA